MTDTFGSPDDDTINVPLPFSGTEEQRRRNYRSHFWDYMRARCVDCDVRYGSTSSFYRCGAPVPRMEVARGSAEAEAALRRSLGTTP